MLASQQSFSTLVCLPALAAGSAGIRTLQVVKTTQSGFSNFHSDEYRSLGDTDDR